MACLDESGIRSEPAVGTGYALVGTAPLLEKSGRRFGVNLIILILLSGGMRFESFIGNFNKEVFQGFLTGLLAASEKKIFLILDNHCSHTCKDTKKWLSERKDKIEVLFLPKYAPDLNPVEYMNHDLKANAFRRGAPVNMKAMQDGIIEFLRRKKSAPAKIQAYFQHRKVKLLFQHSTPEQHLLAW